MKSKCTTTCEPLSGHRVTHTHTHTHTLARIPVEVIEHAIGEPGVVSLHVLEGDAECVALRTDQLLSLSQVLELPLRLVPANNQQCSCVYTTCNTRLAIQSAGHSLQTTWISCHGQL